MHAYVNQPMPCRNCMPFHLKMTGPGPFSTDDARVNLPSFQKVKFFLRYEIVHKDAIRFYFCLHEDVSDCCD